MKDVNHICRQKHYSNGIHLFGRPDGKCIRGKNGNMLVEFETGEKVVVLGRLLRKAKK